MRVLLIKPSSFGDIIHTLPIAYALSQHPEIKAVDWVVNVEYQSLLEGNSSIRKVIPFPRHQGVGRLFLKFLAALREETYDWVIDLQGLLRSGLMTRWVRAKRKIGMSDSREGARFFYSEIVPITATHAIERYRQVLSFLEIPCDVLNFSLPTAPLTFELPDSFLLLHPSSRWPTKALPENLVKALVEQLAPQSVVIIGQGKTWNLPGALDLTNQTNLKELIALIEKAKAVISTDSGPMHLAAALNKPLVTLFGPTSPAKTGPWTSQSRVLQLDLPCIPCLSRHCRIAETQACLRQISASSILGALKEVLH